MPPELVRKFHEIDPCTDVMCVNQMGFVTSIGHPLFFRKTEWAEDGQSKTPHKCLDKTLRVCDQNDFKTEVINCDNGFRAVMDEAVDMMDCRMNCVNAQAREPQMERNN